MCQDVMWQRTSCQVIRWSHVQWFMSRAEVGAGWSGVQRKVRCFITVEAQVNNGTAWVDDAY